ncbi:MAG TPA: peptidoglycan-associated lipoprotein Pal [Methylomirabilota bacterium]|nr:peptidoglycan-associated lipoprotein Pal [Methylomirabilota bacterium]
MARTKGWKLITIHGLITGSLLLAVLILAGCATSSTSAGDVRNVETMDARMGTSKSQIIPARESAGWSGTSQSLQGYAENKDLQDIHFAFDQSLLVDESIVVLNQHADWFKKNFGSLILIEGHADERGTNEYNLALGERRAKAAKDFLVSLGVSHSRINLISYGEERPVCRESVEECWAKNRRDHFMVKLQ